MPDVTALRFDRVVEGSMETVEESDALIAVEVGDFTAERGVDLHVSPRTESVFTCSLSADEAWRLARELARAAAALEGSDG